MLKKGNDCINIQLLYCLYLFESTNFLFDTKWIFTSIFSEVVWWFYFCCDRKFFELRSHKFAFFFLRYPPLQSYELVGLKINISSYISGVFSISEAAILLILHYESNGIFNFLSFYGEVFYMTTASINNYDLPIYI